MEDAFITLFGCAGILIMLTLGLSAAGLYRYSMFCRRREDWRAYVDAVVSMVLAVLLGFLMICVALACIGLAATHII